MTFCYFIKTPKPVIKNTTRQNFSPANKSQTVRKGDYSDQQTIPGLPNLSSLGTLATRLFAVDGEPHFMPRRTELVLQTQSSTTDTVWVLEKEVQSSVSLRGVTLRDIADMQPRCGWQRCFTSQPF